MAANGLNVVAVRIEDKCCPRKDLLEIFLRRAVPEKDDPHQF